jgi:thiol-disulfide isomerase/thioredoxin
MLSLPAFAQNLYEWEKLSPAQPAPTGSFAVAGKKAPGSLQQLRGRVVVLNFWATWCPPCLQELPTLAALQKRYLQRDVVVVAMSVDAQPFHVVQNFLRKKHIAAPLIAHDPQGGVYKPLSSIGLPVTYIIDREGNVAARYEGATDWTDDEHKEMLATFLGK